MGMRRRGGLERKVKNVSDWGVLGGLGGNCGGRGELVVRRESWCVGG